MGYQEKLEKLNRELLERQVPPEVVQDLLSMQLHTEKMRLMLRMLEVGESAAKQLADLQADAELHQELVQLGAAPALSSDGLKEKLAGIETWLTDEKTELEKAALEIEAKLQLLYDPQFIQELTDGELGDNLETAFITYRSNQT